MAHDHELADRLRELLQDETGVREKRMFGGVAFLLEGNMAVAASGQGGLMVRVDPAQTPELVQRPGTSRMVMRGRELDGWLRVDTSAVGDDDLAEWVGRGVAFVRTLPPK